MNVYGANAQVDAQGRARLVPHVPTSATVTPEIDTGRSTLPNPGRPPLPISSGLSPVAGGAGNYQDDDPPTPEEVAEAAAFHYGAE